MDIPWGYFEFYQMEIVTHRKKMLDATESNAKGNVNFATKVISTENKDKNAEEVTRKHQA